MRVVCRMSDLMPNFKSMSSEALALFEDGSMFVERYLDCPQHIKVQIIGDGRGNVIHLWERDCLVQWCHQKVIVMAPAWSLLDRLTMELHRYAVELTGRAE
jgi:pyruvate carboxylase